MQYLIMCRSLTQAQRAAKLLEKNGITASVVKAPQGLSNRGCAYALSLYWKFNEAASLLERNGLLFGKMFQRTADGEYQEV